MTQRRDLASSAQAAIPVSARALYCTDHGVFVWPGVPLVRKRLLPGGGIHFTKCDPQTAWERLLPWHGEEVNGSALAATLTSACAYLNSGDADEARKWVDRLPLPPLRPDALAKINNAWMLQPRVPAGSPEGGRFGSGGGGFQQASMFRSHTPVDLTDDKGQVIITPEGDFKNRPMQRPDDLPPSFFVDRGLEARAAADAGISANGIMGFPSLSPVVTPRALLPNFRQGGTWDAQRVGSDRRSTRAFIDYASVGIGLYGAAAGIPIDEILTYQNEYANASRRSKRALPWTPPIRICLPATSLIPASDTSFTIPGAWVRRRGDASTMVTRQFVRKTLKSEAAAWIYTLLIILTAPLLPVAVFVLPLFLSPGACDYENISRVPSPDGFWVAESRTAICPLAFGGTVMDEVDVFLTTDDKVRFPVYGSDAGLKPLRIEWEATRTLAIFDRHVESARVLAGRKPDGIVFTVKPDPRAPADE